MCVCVCVRARWNAGARKCERGLLETNRLYINSVAWYFTITYMICVVQIKTNNCKLFSISAPKSLPFQW